MGEGLITGIYGPALLGAAGGFLVATLAHFFLVRPALRRRFEREMEEKKGRFIALSSHYLLTPITVIQAAVTRLQEGDARLGVDDRQRLYDSIFLGQQRLWIITEQLVTVNEVDRGRLELNLGVHALAETVTEAIASVDVFARHKNVALRFSDALDDLTEARYDDRRLRQALIAVLDNAVKFSLEEGEVGVRLSMAAGIVTIEVEDHGIGMPADILHHVTEPFSRGADVYTFDYEGIGLGLHIARAIIAEHQGSVSFESRPRFGTRVAIHLPIL